MTLDPDMALRYLHELGRTERLGPADLSAYQEPLLARICAFAQKNVPYWRKRLAPLFRGGCFDYGAWQEVPPLERATIPAKRRQLIAAHPPDFAGESKETWTSGSTGTPQVYLRSEIDYMASTALSERSYGWWQLDGDLNLGIIQFFSYVDDLYLAPQGAGTWRPGAARGGSYGMTIDRPIDEMLRWIVDRDIAYLLTRPTMIELLAQAALQRGLKVPLRAGLTIGSVVSPQCRELVRQAFGIPIHDSYGSRECGHLGAQCPQCGLYHLDAEARLIEVVDGQGRPCRDGEVGRVLVTSFFNFAMPLIRYALGDYAEIGPAQAPCGRGLPSLRRVMGRETEAFMRRDGSRFFPTTRAREFQKRFPIRQVQFVQTDYDTIEVRYVAEPGAAPLQPEAVELFLREKLGPEFKGVLRKVPEIAQAAGAKSFDHVCAIAPAAQR